MENDIEGKLSAAGRVLLKMLRNAIDQLVSGECSDEEINDAIRRLHPDMKGYKCEDDYVTIDEGMRILHFGKNRAGFCKLMKKNGIYNETFNNVKIGYNRNRIIALKHKLDEDFRKRKMHEDKMRMRGTEYKENTDSKIGI